MLKRYFALAILFFGLLSVSFAQVNSDSNTSDTATNLTKTGWHIVGCPVSGATLNNLLGPFWTQGYPGSDEPNLTGDEAPNVYFYDETELEDMNSYGWYLPSSQNVATRPGQGIFWYVYEDDTPLDKSDNIPTSRSINVPDTAAASSSQAFDFTPLLSITGTYGQYNYDATNDGWVLLSNPSKQMMQWGIWDYNSAWSHASNVDWNCYIIDGNTGNYVSISHTVNYGANPIPVSIAPYQGFWVHLTSYLTGGVTLRANASAFYDESSIVDISTKSADYTNTVREARFTLNADDSLLTNEFGFYWFEDASIDLDKYDAYELGNIGYGDYSNIFSRLQTNDDSRANYAIDFNALPSDTSNIELRFPIVLRSTISSAQTLEINDSHFLLPEHLSLYYETLEGEQSLVGADFTVDLSIQSPSAKARHTANIHPSALLQSDEGTLVGYIVVKYGTMTSVNADSESLPAEFTLSQNYPNPFNPSTTIQFNLDATSHIKLEVFNQAGQLIQTLMNNVQSAGTHQVQFDGKNLASGVYFYRLTTNGKQLTKRMTLLK